MTIAAYKACFYTLSKYSSASISTEFEWTQKFIKELDGTYQLAIAQMVVSGASSLSIIEHSKIIELIIQDTMEAPRRCIIIVSLVDMSLEVDIFLVEVPEVIMVGQFNMLCRDQVVGLQFSNFRQLDIQYGWSFQFSFTFLD